MRQTLLLATVLSAIAIATPSWAAFVIEIDTDGADDGPITYNSNFAFGGDTTTASTSSAANVVGLTGADSIFGGDGSAQADTYTYRYTPGVDGDNTVLASGTPLNDDGDFATGLVAGGSGTYNVYAAWPITNNVSGGLTNFRLEDSMGASLFTTAVNQNSVNGFVDPANGQTFAGGEWVLVGTADLLADETYTLFQETSNNTFVSMRASGVLFDQTTVPEPGTLALGGLAAAGMLVFRRYR